MKQTLQKILAILLAAMLLCSLILFSFPAVLPQNFGDGTANEETLPPSEEDPNNDAPQEGETEPPSTDEPPDDDAPQGGGSGPPSGGDTPDAPPADAPAGPPVSGGGTDDAPQEPEDTAAEAAYIRTLADSVLVRSGPGKQYAAVGSLDAGDMIAMQGTRGGWYQTVYRGKKAYITASSALTEIYTIVQSADEKVEAVIACGAELLGFPYVYGAARLHDGAGNLTHNFSATKFDCSSLMQYIFYYGAGVLLQTTTRLQVRQEKMCRVPRYAAATCCSLRTQTEKTRAASSASATSPSTSATAISCTRRKTTPSSKRSALPAKAILSKRAGSYEADKAFPI